MRKEEKTIKLFIAEDGKEFLDEKSCIHYEDKILTKLKKIKYFKFFTRRDLNETGLFYRHNYAAVYIKDGTCHYEVLLQHLISVHKNKILTQGVQGFGVMSAFEITACTKEQYFEKKPNRWGGSPVESEQIFLSEIFIEGYPENTKVVSKYLKVR